MTTPLINTIVSTGMKASVNDTQPTAQKVAVLLRINQVLIIKSRLDSSQLQVDIMGTMPVFPGSQGSEFGLPRDLEGCYTTSAPMWEVCQ